MLARTAARAPADFNQNRRRCRRHRATQIACYRGRRAQSGAARVAPATKARTCAGDNNGQSVPLVARHPRPPGPACLSNQTRPRPAQIGSLARRPLDGRAMTNDRRPPARKLTGAPDWRRKGRRPCARNINHAPTNAASPLPLTSHRIASRRKSNRANPPHLNQSECRNPSRTTIEPNDKTLVIEALRPSDEGVYICEGENSIGSARALAQVRVTCKYSAHISPPPRTTHRARRRANC